MSDSGPNRRKHLRVRMKDVNAALRCPRPSVGIDLSLGGIRFYSGQLGVKSGDRLAAEEIESLLEQRHLIDDAHHCPHGRPTALNLSRAELDRQFGRLG